MNDMPAPVLALCADLLFAARIRGAGQAAGTNVTIARNAQDLLARAESERPPRILLDLDARTHDPIEVITQLKSNATTASIPIVAFVSHVREEMIERAREAGADKVMARSAFVKKMGDMIRKD